jgi:hypothetical protein
VPAVGDDQPSTVARVLIAGVDHTLTAIAVPPRVVRFDRNLGIRYVTEAELTEAKLDPAFWIRPIAPGAPDRRVLFETLANETVEQDVRGQIWVDDQPLLPAKLISYGIASSGQEREHELEVGRRAALLLMERQPGGWDFRIRLTTPVIWIHACPRSTADGPVMGGWLGLAHRALIDLGAEA